MTFIDLICLESFNSNYKITKKEIGKFGVELYYLDMEKEYRIFIEDVDGYLHIGFERKLDEWTVTPITDDLTTSEILGLFGTIKILIESRKFKGIWIETDNSNKHQLYFNIINRLNRELNFTLTRDDYSVFIYSDTYYIPNIKNKFRYKKLF